MENMADWAHLGVIMAACVWVLIAQSRRIKRENADALAEFDRRMREAHESGRRGLPYIAQPRQ